MVWLSALENSIVEKNVSYLVWGPRCQGISSDAVILLGEVSCQLLSWQWSNENASEMREFLHDIAAHGNVHAIF
jgi:hypothetical protein